MKLLAFMLAFFAVGGTTYAQSPACRTANTQGQLNVCASQKLKAADATLSKFYTSYMKRLDPDQARLFKAANVAWAKYRKLYCKFQASGSLGGSAYPMVYTNCMATQATLRLHQLHKTLVLQCQHEGNFSCPAWSSPSSNSAFKPTPNRSAVRRGLTLR